MRQVLFCFFNNSLPQQLPSLNECLRNVFAWFHKAKQCFKLKLDSVLWFVPSLSLSPCKVRQRGTKVWLYEPWIFSWNGPIYPGNWNKSYKQVTIETRFELIVKGNLYFDWSKYFCYLLNQSDAKPELIKLITKFSNTIRYHRPDLSTNRIVYASCL